MYRLAAIAALAATSLAGCGIPPVDTSMISQTPADSRRYTVAQKAVKACSQMPDGGKVLRYFRQSGFSVSKKKMALRGGREISRVVVKAPDPDVSVLYHGSGCYVGLKGMTPDQSYRLAGIAARALNAQPNSAYGEGLSDHVAGAWRRFFTTPPRFPDKAAYEHRIFVAAYKTWPHGPYDPQRSVPFNIDGLFPKAPGAAVKISYTSECKPIVSTGPRSGVFLPC